MANTTNKIKTTVELLNQSYLFLPSAVSSPTLPIAFSHTVSAAQDMDHHFPVMVQNGIVQFNFIDLLYLVCA